MFSKAQDGVASLFPASTQPLSPKSLRDPYVKYAQCVSTGTVAIQAALKAIEHPPGDEVIAPAYTWRERSVRSSAQRRSVFVDVDPDTYCLDWKLVEQAITPKTKAILPVHLGMRFADMDELLRIAQKHNLKIVEDCAHATAACGRERAPVPWRFGRFQLSVEQADHVRRRGRRHHQ